MDSLNHSVQGFLLGYIPTDNIYIGIASGLAAAVPDLCGEFMAMVQKDEYAFYKAVHNFKHWLSFIPPITLHVALDKLGHDEDKRWYAGKWYEYLNPFSYKESMWLESITWLINILLILILFVL